MTDQQLLERFPNASKSFIKANATDIRATATEIRQADLHPDGPGPLAKLERVAGDGAMGAVSIQKGIGRRFRVVVKSRRKRLLDIDNLAEKYHVDLCRYAGVISSDAPGTTEIEVSQEKVFGKEPEEVVIEVWEV